MLLLLLPCFHPSSSLSGALFLPWGNPGISVVCQGTLSLICVIGNPRLLSTPPLGSSPTDNGCPWWHRLGFFLLHQHWQGSNFCNEVFSQHLFYWPGKLVVRPGFDSRPLRALAQQAFMEPLWYARHCAGDTEMATESPWPSILKRINSKCCWISMGV